MPLHQAKAIFFDLDDTLIDHQGALDLAIKDVYEERGELKAEFPELASLQRAWKDALKKYFPFYLAGTMTHEEQRLARVQDIWEMAKVPLTRDEYRKISDQYLLLYRKHWRPLPATISTLDALAGFKLGVVTNGWGQQQREKLAKCGLEAYFSSVVVSNEVGAAKPEAKIFQVACAQLGVDPQEAVFVGDLYEADIVGAHGAGLMPVWLEKDKRQHAKNPLNALCVTTLTELLPLFAKP